MRDVTIKVYKYAELSAKARDSVRYEYQSQVGYIHEDEALASLSKLAEHFGGTLFDFDISWSNSRHSSAKFNMPEDMGESNIKASLDQLGAYNDKTLLGAGECKLTGICFDEDAIDGFRKAFFAGERDLGVLMHAAFDTWLKACQEDYKDFYSDQMFADHCEANEYEFYADGREFCEGK